MPPKISPLEQANRSKEREPNDLGLSADYRQWISFEGCCSPAAEPTAESKLHDELQAGQEHAHALPAHRKTLQGSD